MASIDGETRRIVRWGLTAGVGLVLLLGGCGLGGPSASPLALTPVAALKAAATNMKSASAQTVHFNGTASVGSLGTVQIGGVEQFGPSLAADMTIDLSGGSSSAVGGGSLEIVLKDGVQYLKLVALGSQLPGAKQWLKIDLKALANMSGSAGGLLSLGKLTQSTDPSEQVELLITSSDIKSVGSETVDGVKAIHYAGTIDVAKFVQQNAAGSLSPDELQKLKDGLQQAGITSEHIDIWLDKANLPVEIKASVSSTALGEIRSEMHFTDWGSPVTITPPPPDQVVDISQLGAGRVPSGG